MNFHPDQVQNRTGSVSPEVQQKVLDYSSGYSSFINDAYETLKDNYSRTRYLLRLNHIDIPEEFRHEDMEVLEEIMEIRLVIEETTERDEVERMVIQYAGVVESLLDEV